MSDPYTDIVMFISNASPAMLGCGGVIILLCVLGFVHGKDTLIAVLVALYVGAAVMQLFPLYPLVRSTFALSESTPLRLYMFGLTTTVAFMVFRRYVYTLYQHSTFWRIFEIILLSLLIVGFAGSVTCYIMGSTGFVPALGPVATLFVPSYALAVWLIAPLVSFPLFIRPS